MHIEKMHWFSHVRMEIHRELPIIFTVCIWITFVHNLIIIVNNHFRLNSTIFVLKTFEIFPKIFTESYLYL